MVQRAHKAKHGQGRYLSSESPDTRRGLACCSAQAREAGMLVVVGQLSLSGALHADAANETRYEPAMRIDQSGDERFLLMDTTAKSSPGLQWDRPRSLL